MKEKGYEDYHMLSKNLDGDRKDVDELVNLKNETVNERSMIDDLERRKKKAREIKYSKLSAT